MSRQTIPAVFGPSIMRVGIEKSRNLMTARLTMSLGMEEIQSYARRFGLNDNLPPLLSMSLGAGETTLLRLTATYGMLVMWTTDNTNPDRPRSGPPWRHHLPS